MLFLKSKRKFKFIYQRDRMDCGPACLQMISKYHGIKINIEKIRKLCHLNKNGVSLTNLQNASSKLGFDAYNIRVSEKTLIKVCPLPCILHWNHDHYVVLISKKNDKYKIADPGHGIIKLSANVFKEKWAVDENDKGVALSLVPNQLKDNDNFIKERIKISFILKYLKPYKKQLYIMFILLLLGSAVTLILPFLTEALIDRGVNAKDLNFIFIILLAQLGLFLGSIIFSIYRNWLMLYIGTHISITIISDFFNKLFKLPIIFFETKVIGDFNQRINDNQRIEEFLTSQSLTTFFSIITFSVFFGVLWYYDFKILLVYLVLTIVSIGWSFYWLKKRRVLDYFRFQERSENQESIYEMLNGVTEMKLSQFEDFKIKEWENIQQKLFKLNTRILKLDQVQLSGFEFFNQLKNIIVTFLAATYVVQNSMTLGMLLSISYIIGQMNSPVNQLVSFFRSLQDAKLSLERLNEVQNHEPEENKQQKQLFDEKDKNSGIKKGIYFKNLSFQYEGPKSPFVLKNINLYIPEGKITAIVGASGSGKTTLMKLLLRFYTPSNGEIFYNQNNILTISPKSIRENTGVVMQDGYIFSETIERNIVTKANKVSSKQLKIAVQTANIEEFVESLPLKYNTKIGAAGNGLSGGQRQRMLIARAIYKNPHYIFFDEATSALDAENEKVIHNNLQDFFQNKTVVIIAHRLSTVKNADQIIVLSKGRVVEKGKHSELINNKGYYYKLVKNQLNI